MTSGDVSRTDVVFCDDARQLVMEVVWMNRSRRIIALSAITHRFRKLNFYKWEEERKCQGVFGLARHKRWPRESVHTFCDFLPPITISYLLLCLVFLLRTNTQLHCSLEQVEVVQEEILYYDSDDDNSYYTTTTTTTTTTIWWKFDYHIIRK